MTEEITKKTRPRSAQHQAASLATELALLDFKEKKELRAADHKAIANKYAAKRKELLGESTPEVIQMAEALLKVGAK